MLDIASNYQNKFVSKFCPLCRYKESLDTKEHLLTFPQLINGHQVTKEILSYEDLFGENVEKQIKVACMIQRKFQEKKREAR